MTSPTLKSQNSDPGGSAGVSPDSAGRGESPGSIARAPLPPPWLGVGIALAILLPYLGVLAAMGSLEGLLSTGDAHLWMHLRITTVCALFIGYLPVARIYLARWTRGHAEELRPLLGELHEEAIPPEGGGLRVGLIGSLLMLLGFLVLPHPATLTEREHWTFLHAFDWLTVSAIGWQMARFVHALVASALAISRLAARIPELDLFDLEPLRPFVRQGLRSVLLVMVLLWISTGMFGIVVVSATSGLAIMLVLVLVASAALVLPVHGVHQRIVQEKRAKLAELRAAVRGAEAALLSGSSASSLQSGRSKGAGGAGREAAGAPGAELPGLLALESRIEAVREWPFDASSLLRFALYLVVGLGSWLGAAAVERLLDRLLG